MSALNTTCCLSVFAVAAAFLSGCARDERFEKASAVRTDRITRHLVAFDEREGKCGPHLSDLDKLIREHIAYHQQQLPADIDFINARLAQEVDLWPGRLAGTQEYIAEKMRGKPEVIPEAIARMWY